jgi:hypothetical protein
VCTGVVESQLSAVNVYPNPFNEMLNISSDEVISEVNIFDMQGKLLMSKPIQSRSAQIETNTLPAGMYVLRVVSESGTKNTPVIKY